ncbi:S-methyl-5-thioribose-1-phosphate isomerase [Desulfovibrio litoralis]|uniref:Methylthioribose-1-phosphate isomerase n=1 Tax=Desulfovibrio litoralis DSM 11393 TaxID=1121455 RepID=A0A1M7TMX9_9BACT|nr:S-methyl-5-thioribose-1-phosphate isomerase [Desulfovibrio litoralis]SHN72087.1 methylthioribose-1-phosphate isomerase [Desulfovibrio litoralis DSM 11393]
MVEHIYFSDDTLTLTLLDQRFLPVQEDFFVCQTTDDIVKALQVMVVRGAPAIGVSAAFGACIALNEALNTPDWRVTLAHLLEYIANARPTAVNLRWAIKRMRKLWLENNTIEAKDLLALWLKEARLIQQEDIENNRKMGFFGGELLQDGWTIMTHCNAGALATAGYGTALGVIRGAIEQNKHIKVIANETRPFLQGARLTAYELAKDGIEVSVACDNACALLMQRKLVDAVVVGADRIAANGDTANKIGTYGVAIIAKEHGIPFYVAAPSSTIDIETLCGEDIPIETRPSKEVSHIGEHRLIPYNVKVFNFAFDVTPAKLITGIITENGVLRNPYQKNIAELFKHKK